MPRSWPHPRVSAGRSRIRAWPRCSWRFRMRRFPRRAGRAPAPAHRAASTAPRSVSAAYPEGANKPRSLFRVAGVDLSDFRVVLLDPVVAVDDRTRQALVPERALPKAVAVAARHADHLAEGDSLRDRDGIAALRQHAGGRFALERLSYHRHRRRASRKR